MTICPECGSERSPEDMELTFRRPDGVAILSDEERKSRVQENNDLCVFDGKRFFVPVLLPLSVVERDQPYNIGILVEVSQQTFERVYELWDEESQTNEPAFQSEIANSIRIRTETCGLHGLLSLTGPTTRPDVTLQPVPHALFGEQSRGISAHRAAQYSSFHAPGAA